MGEVDIKVGLLYKINDVNGWDFLFDNEDNEFYIPVERPVFVTRAGSNKAYRVHEANSAKLYNKELKCVESSDERVVFECGEVPNFRFSISSETIGTEQLISDLILELTGDIVSTNECITLRAALGDDLLKKCSGDERREFLLDVIRSLNNPVSTLITCSEELYTIISEILLTIALSYAQANYIIMNRDSEDICITYTDGQFEAYVHNGELLSNCIRDIEEGIKV